uniref:Myb/SANT-like DNA-binding domain-containing protein n=1 Tax=Paramormyrops kingsleyae TaxID=1676925 RepID=A0A3B3R8G5_9TELE
MTGHYRSGQEDGQSSHNEAAEKAARWLWLKRYGTFALDGTTRNKKVFAIISSRLEHMGDTRNTEQCRLKIKKLKQDYRKVKDHNNRSGADRKTNTWFEALDAVLGHRPTNTCRSNIVDSAMSPLISSQATEEHSVTEDNSGKMK